MFPNKKIVLAAIFAALSFVPSDAFSQIKFKLQWLPDSLAWGVFAKPDGVSPSMNTLVGSGQVTVVAPLGYTFKELKNFSGKWSQNAYVHAPSENPERDYVSFGFSSEEYPLRLQTGEETLLFTFTKKAENFPDTLYLMANDDPFYAIPNSANANAGNDLSMMDMDKGLIYFYSGNYATEAWNPTAKVPQGPFRQGGNGVKKQMNRP